MRKRQTLFLVFICAPISNEHPIAECMTKLAANPVKGHPQALVCRELDNGDETDSPT